MGGSTPSVPGRIFISYRRQETAYPAGWLYERVAAHFGREQVFKDVDSIVLGDDFAEVIANAVGSCDVLLALIGDRWLAITDEDGRRRLDDPDDFVRLEIETALKRNIRVIPVLFEGASLPRATDLPASLAKLVRRQALELSPSRFDADIGRLLRVLDTTLADEQARREKAARAAREAEDQARWEAEAQAAHEAEQQARREEAAKAAREAENRTRREAQATAAREAEEHARREAVELKLSAIDAVAQELHSGNPSVVASAEGALRRLADDANQRVVQAATSLLADWEAEKQAQREAKAKPGAEDHAKHDAKAKAKQEAEQAKEEAAAAEQVDAVQAPGRRREPALVGREYGAQFRMVAKTKPRGVADGVSGSTSLAGGGAFLGRWRASGWVAVAVTLTGLVIGWSIHSSGVGARNPPAPIGHRVVATIPVGSDPVAVAVGAGAAWVTNFETGTVSRIDPARNRVVGTIKVGRNPVRLAVGAGAVWVTSLGDKTVSRIDPTGNRVVATIPFSTTPYGVATGAGAVWVTNDNAGTLSRIDPAANRVVGTIKVGRNPVGVAVGAGAAWVTNHDDGTASQIDPTDNRVVATIKVGPAAEGIAVDTGALWVANGSGSGTVSRVQP